MASTNVISGREYFQLNTQSQMDMKLLPHHYHSSLMATAFTILRGMCGSGAMIGLLPPTIKIMKHIQTQKDQQPAQQK